MSEILVPRYHTDPTIHMALLTISWRSLQFYYTSSEARYEEDSKKARDSHDVIHGPSGINQYMTYVVSNTGKTGKMGRSAELPSKPIHSSLYIRCQSWKAGFRSCLCSLQRAAQKVLAIFSLNASLLAFDENMARSFCVALGT